MEDFRESFIPFLREFVSARVERLSRDAERQPECLQRRGDVEDMCREERMPLSEAQRELFAYVVRGADHPVREYVYRAGFADGIRCAELFRRLGRD